MTYEFTDHTADYAMRARGADFPGLLRSAVVGLMHLLADVDGLSPASHVDLAAQGHSREDLLVHALKEVLYLQDDGLLAASLEGLDATESEATFRVGVVSLAGHRERLAGAVKAVTYHNLQVRESAEGLEVEVVFDT
jgi:SHS2 domain-containing protein